MVLNPETKPRERTILRAGVGPPSPRGLGKHVWAFQVSAAKKQQDLPAGCSLNMGLLSPLGFPNSEGLHALAKEKNSYKRNATIFNPEHECTDAMAFFAGHKKGANFQSLAGNINKT